MKVYISGISGTGMGPLALLANDAGIEVVGSDLAEGAIYGELVDAGIRVKIGAQDGEFLKENLKGLDWFVYTSALPKDHPELVAAQEAGVKCTKRDDFTAYLVDKLGLKMVAVAGTHGKTTTTAMIVWACLKLGFPVSYVVGTTLGFAKSGSHRDGDEYFVYEADEYDRNFLKFSPWFAVITNISYDHPDIYKNPRDYRLAFLQFKAQSKAVLDTKNVEATQEVADKMFTRLAGPKRRLDAVFAAGAVMGIWKDLASELRVGLPDFDEVVRILNGFPGVGRRFERITDGLYTDYAHHPEEIAATVEVAREQAKIEGRKGVVVVYQPHQNARQVELKDGYREAFVGVDKILWLPTYLTREPEGVGILSPEELMAGLKNSSDAEVAELSQALASRLLEYLDDGYLVILMTAGPADAWLRKVVGEV